MSAAAIAIGNATTTIVARINVSYRQRFAMTASGRSEPVDLDVATSGKGNPAAVGGERH
jgi:hypothetical protein